MGKVKQWAEDMAEEYLDSLESKVKSRNKWQFLRLLNNKRAII
mgnify:CR=1 FL=1